VLNRVQSIDPTHIDGSLLANGRVYITNPAGVYFGHGAFVDVGAIYAAAGNIANEDFLRGIDHFTDVTGAVTNFGDINADMVGLIGSHVANHGSVTADEGIVLFLAGEDVYIGKINDNVFVKIVGKNADAANDATAAGKADTLGVENSGSVRATGGNVTFGAGDLYSIAIRTTGKVQAEEITINAGTKGTVLVSGSIDASEVGEGGTGGNISITGEKVGLFGADVDASGDSGGGTVLIGGDYQGKGELPTAETTYVSGDSTIKADAVENGNGGKVIVWADGKTSYFGEISARGGANGGDGGFVEVSGKKSLTFAGKVDTRAPQGKTGTLLLDPTDIEVVADAHPDRETLDPTDVNEFADPDLPDPPGTDGDTKIGISALETTAADNNVILQATNDITFNEPVNMPNANAGITAQAGNDIIVNQSITTAGGSIVFSANDNGGGTATGTGSIDINAAIDTNGGSFTSSGDNFNNTGGTITATGGITISNDSATLAADLDGGGGLISGSVNTVNVNSPGSIQDGIDVAADNATITTSDGTFTEDLVVSNVSGLTLESTNGMAATTIQLVDGVGIDIQSTAPTFTLGGDADDGFTILSGGATTFLTQLTNAPSNVTISNNTFDTTGNATQGISIGAAGATDLTIS
ncbi:MAG: filamentous hemagglutinin N-terminal domain-containing protein, partial [Sedimentisphaerales bacterium]|nr:filamentous hemagglutinin N-terminal domain-containing protein [Sedimentisphaerales bacterium]